MVQMADAAHLTIDDETVDGIRIICPKGKLETLSAKDFEAHLKSAAQESDSSLLIDMSGVDYVTSFGLRSLLIITKQIAPAGRKLILFGVNPSVHEVLKISGFLKILSVVETRDDALAEIRG
jgi:anti-anti-sigma factor